MNAADYVTMAMGLLGMLASAVLAIRAGRTMLRVAWLQAGMWAFLVALPFVLESGFGPRVPLPACDESEHRVQQTQAQLRECAEDRERYHAELERCEHAK